jgi:hypothetical protein
VIFNMLINSTQVQPRIGSSSMSSGGSIHHRHTEQDIVNTEQDIVNGNVEQRLRENE